MIKVYVYFKDGNVDIYEVESEWKAREHAEKILTTGYRMRVGDRMEWFLDAKEWLSKICWDVTEGDYLGNKYEGGTQKKK